MTKPDWDAREDTWNLAVMDGDIDESVAGPIFRGAVEAGRSETARADENYAAGKRLVDERDRRIASLEQQLEKMPCGHVAANLAERGQEVVEVHYVSRDMALDACEPQMEGQEMEEKHFISNPVCAVCEQLAARGPLPSRQILLDLFLKTLAPPRRGFFLDGEDFLAIADAVLSHLNEGGWRE